MKKHRLDKQAVHLVLSGIMVMLLLLFIFSNSMQSGEDSNERSGRIMKLIQVLLDPHGNIPQDSLHWFVRKLAHFTEFAALGAALWWLMENIRILFGRSHPLAAPFCSLSAAVTDEYIQSFTGRTSSVQDVLIDFCGAIAAILFLTLIFVILAKRRMRKNVREKC